MRISKFTNHTIELRVWPIHQFTGGNAFRRYLTHLDRLVDAFIRHKLSKDFYQQVRTEGEDDVRGHWLGTKIITRVRKSLTNPKKDRIIWIRI